MNAEGYSNGQSDDNDGQTLTCRNCILIGLKSLQEESGPDQWVLSRPEAMTERRLDTELQQFGNVRTQKLCKQVKGYV